MWKCRLWPFLSHPQCVYRPCCPVVISLNSSRPRRNRRHFADDIFKCIFLNGNIWISIEISLKFVPKGPINNIPALVQIMAWRRPGDKPLSKPMLVFVSTHICVTRPQWGKTHWGRVAHICVGKLTIIGTDNGLSSGRCRAITWTNAWILLIRPLGTNSSENVIGISIFSFGKMYLKTSAKKSYQGKLSCAFPVNLPSCECQNTSLMISQHWFR